MAETIKIGGELESTATGNKVADVANVKDKTKGNKSQFQINAEHEAAISNRYTKEETYNKEEVEQMVTPPNPDYKYYATYADMTAETSHPAGAIYRVSSYDGTQVDNTSYAEYTWNGSEYKLLAVKSQINEIFDISAYTGDTYDDLADALGEDGENVLVKRGGMRIQFVRSSDNKYVQARFMLSGSFTNAQFTNVTNWQVVEKMPTDRSNNLVYSGGIDTRAVNGSEIFLRSLDDIKRVGFINSQGVLENAGSGFCIPVEGIKTVNIRALTANAPLYYAFLKTNVYETGVVSFCDGTSRILLNENPISESSIPQDCKYIWFSTATSSTQYSVASTDFRCIINGVDFLGNFYTHINNIFVTLGARIGTLLPIDGNFDYNTSTKTMSIPSKFDIIGNGKSGRISSYSGGNVTFSNSGSREQLFVYDEDTKTLKSIQADYGVISKVAKKYIILGAVDTTTGAHYFNFTYLENGKSIVRVNYDNFPIALSTNILNSDKIAKYHEKGCEKVVADFDFVGKGTTQVLSSYFYLGKNRDYRIKNTDWNYNASTQAKFFIYGLNTGSYVENVVVTLDYNYSKSSYELNTGSGYDYYLIKLRANTNANVNIVIEDVTEKKEIAKDYNSIIADPRTMANAAHFWHGDRESFVEDYFDNLYLASEESTFNSFLEKIQARKTTGVYQMAFITDTHEGGQSVRINQYAFRCIRTFNRLASNVDICAHGGDISSDYGTSLQRYFAYMQEAMRQYKIPSAKNFLITKGNHDAKDKNYAEVSPFNVDWDNGSYFVSPSWNNFVAVTKDTYRGGELYVQKTELMPDKLFRFIQSQNVPASAVWGNGAYYYYDVNDYKIRFIVANSYPVNDSGSQTEIEEYNWFMQTALDLSDKDIPTDWLVVCLRHSESTSIPKFNRIVSAFMTGGSDTEGSVTVNYGTLNGGGVKFVTLHGHEHDTAGYSNMAGYLDLGFLNGAVSKSNLGTAATYPVYVLSIDTVNKKIISDLMKGDVSIQYDYDDNIVELNVGQTLLMARSGLSDQTNATWVSSDNSIATVGENTGIVTAIGAGIATITGTEGTTIKTYTVKVIN